MREPFIIITTVTIFTIIIIIIITSSSSSSSSSSDSSSSGSSDSSSSSSSSSTVGMESRCERVLGWGGEIALPVILYFDDQQLRMLLLHISMYVDIYIYIYIERERGRSLREGSNAQACNVGPHEGNIIHCLHVQTRTTFDNRIRHMSSLCSNACLSLLL